MSTPAAGLTGVGWIDSNVGPASFFRFAGQFTEKFRPTGVMNAFGETMVMRHAVDMQVFHTDDPKGIDNLAAFLMGEVVTPKSDALMHPSHGFSSKFMYSASLTLYPASATAPV